MYLGILIDWHVIEEMYSIFFDSFYFGRLGVIKGINRIALLGYLDHQP